MKRGWCCSQLEKCHLDYNEERLLLFAARKMSPTDVDGRALQVMWNAPSPVPGVLHQEI